MKAFILAIILSTFSGHSLGEQNIGNSDTDNKSIEARKEVYNLNGRLRDKESEIALLKQQNNTIRYYQESLLSTVYWSLSGVFTMTLLLAGFGWWTNSRMYESDKERISDDVNSKVNAFDAKISLKLEESKIDFIQLMDSKLDQLISKINQEEIESRSMIESLKKATAGLEEKLRISIEASDAKSLGLSKSILEQTAELRSVEEHVWRIKEIPGNILITQAQGLKAAMAADNRSQVSRILERMKKTIEEDIIKASRTPSATSISLAASPLEEAVAYNAVLVNEIRELLENITPKQSASDDD